MLGSLPCLEASHLKDPYTLVHPAILWAGRVAYFFPFEAFDLLEWQFSASSRFVDGLHAVTVSDRRSTHTPDHHQIRYWGRSHTPSNGAKLGQDTLLAFRSRGNPVGD